MKYSTTDIIVKQLAHHLREKYPHLRIEGHPRNEAAMGFDTPTSLIITNKDRDYLLKFIFFSIEKETLRIHLTQRNNPGWAIPKNKTIDLTEPTSIDHIEHWISRYITAHKTKNIARS